MRRKAREGTSNAWVDSKILTTVSIFPREGNFKRDLLEVGPSSNWGVFIL